MENNAYCLTEKRYCKKSFRKHIACDLKLETVHFGYFHDMEHRDDIIETGNWSCSRGKAKKFSFSPFPSNYGFFTQEKEVAGCTEWLRSHRGGWLVSEALDGGLCQHGCSACHSRVCVGQRAVGRQRAGRGGRLPPLSGRGRLAARMAEGGPPSPAPCAPRGLQSGLGQRRHLSRPLSVRRLSAGLHLFRERLRVCLAMLSRLSLCRV